ncbi:hypothetical protein CCYA_CCYA18G4558 [Cyanidiococcus yangmingshanensis]|nr:hypothetical protein CCYA_CCYA18G4558 [Cyanidiococcus yangmingshanensis]
MYAFPAPLLRPAESVSRGFSSGCSVSKHDMLTLRLRYPVLKKCQSFRELSCKLESSDGKQFINLLKVATQARESEELEFVQKHSGALVRKAAKLLGDPIRDRIKKDSAFGLLALGGGAIAALLHLINLVPFASTFFEMFGILAAALIAWRSLHRSLIIDKGGHVKTRYDSFLKRFRSIKTR